MSQEHKGAHVAEVKAGRREVTIGVKKARAEVGPGEQFVSHIM